jgi:hypothetical protein
VRTLAAWLEMHSDGADEAGIARYSIASLSKFWNMWAATYGASRQSNQWLE